MPTFQREDISPLHFTLSATLAPSDYEPDFDAELQKYRKQSSLKGFRKGKTPPGVLRKMFGKSVLADILNKKLQQAIADYMRQNQLDMLGGPLQAEDNDQIELDIREMQDYTFRFEIGIAPKFEVSGAGPESEYSRFEVAVTDEMVTEEINHMREQHRRNIPVEEGFQEDDLIKFSVVEMEGDSRRIDGLESSFEAMVSQIKNEAVKSQVMAARKGDSLRINMFDTFVIDEQTLLRDWLVLSEEDRPGLNDWFEATIESATREELPSIDQEFLDSIFGPGRAQTEAEAREIMRQELTQMFLRPANSLMFVEIRERIIRENQIPMPEEFLKKWMAYNNEDMEPEAIEAGFEKFIEGLRWNLIRDKLADQLGVDVTDEELEEFFRRRVRGYFGASPYIDEDFIHNMAMRLMEREESVREAYDELFTDKLFHAVAAQVSIAPKPISKEDFDREMEAVRQRYRPAPAAPAEDLSAEVEEVVAETLSGEETAE